MNKKLLKASLKDKAIKKICKERGWNINELTTGQMLFIMNQPEVKDIK